MEELVDVSTTKNPIRIGLCQTFLGNAAIVMLMAASLVP